MTAAVLRLVQSDADLACSACSGLSSTPRSGDLCEKHHSAWMRSPERADWQRINFNRSQFEFHFKKFLKRVGRSP